MGGPCTTSSRCGPAASLRLLIAAVTAPPKEKQGRRLFPAGSFRFFRPVHAQRPVSESLALYCLLRHILLIHVAIMQIAVNRNREQVGMDVPKRLRELEIHKRNKRLKEAEYPMPLNRDFGA